MYGRGVLLLGLLFALWTSGCVHFGHHVARVGPEAALPKLTAVTTWPLALLLTNGSAFGAEFTLTLDNAPKPPLKLSGELLVRGGKLRLEVAKSNGKSLRTGDFGVIWDAAAHQGYIFSEALQGCAPIKETVHCTNLLIQMAPEEAERIDGHPMDKANATVTGSDGQTILVQLLRAKDLGNLPLKIYSPADSPYSFALELSNIQLVKPAEKLFLPPDGFTEYDNATALLDELASRRQNEAGGDNDSAGPGGSYEPKGDHRAYGIP